MTIVPTLIIQLVQNASLLALLVIGYGAIKRGRLNGATERIALGLLFGVASVGTMSLSIDISPQIHLSVRSVPLALAGMMAGPVGAVVALAIAVPFRFWHSAEGALASSLAMTATPAIGLIAARFGARRTIDRSAWFYAATGLVCIIPGTLIFSALGLTKNGLFLEALIPLTIVVPLAMAATGMALRQEDERRALQDRLGKQTILFEAIFHSISDGVTVSNERGEIVMVNPAAVVLSGAEETTRPSADWAQHFGLFEPDGKTPFPIEAMPLVRALKGEATNGVEVVVRNERLNGDRLLNVDGRPLIGKDGARHGAIAVFRDTTAQRALADALRRSEERLAMAIAGSQDGMVDYNPVTGEVWFSSRFKEILGYTDDEFPNDIQFWKSRMLPEDHVAVTSRFFDFEAGRCSSLHIVQRFRHKDGHVIHLNSRAQGQRGPDGKVIRLIGTVTDITPLVQLEQRLKDAIDVMVDGFGLFGADDRLILFNDAFMDEGTRKVLGEDPTGRTFEEIARAFAYHDMPVADPTFDREAWIASRMERHRNPPTDSIEVEWSGGRCMRISERRTSDGGYVGVWTDVTPLKAAEARLRDAIESINEGFALFDHEHRYITYNQRLLELHPLSAPAVAVGAKLEDVLRYGALHGEYPGITTATEAEAFVAQRIQRFTAAEPVIDEIRFADGRWMLASHRRTSAGGYVTVRTDITAQKQREFELTQTRNRLIDQARQLARLAETLRQARLAADRASQEKSRFLASMSHELRTPLNAILGFSDLMRNQIYGPVEPVQYGEYVRLIHDSGSHLLSLINDVLDLSKVEAGKMEMEMEDLDAAAMLGDVEILMTGLAAERGVTLKTAIGDGIKTVYADRRAMKQILLNLVSNSVKFTPEGGEVRITVEIGTAGDICVAVADTGIGMSTEDLTKALQPYGQIRAEIARPNIGTGLGLPLAKALTELNGGQFEIRSEKGKGTTVTLHLPRPSAPPALKLVAVN